MAAPTWDGLVKTVQTGLTTPHVINMPTGLANSDGVVVVTAMGRNRTQGLNWNTGTTGFASLLTSTVFATAGNDIELDIGWAVMPSSGGLPSSISLTPSQSKSFAAWAGRIPAGSFDPATTPVATQTANSSDPASLDPPWDEDTLFIAGYAAQEFSFSTYPLADDQANDETGLATGAVCSIGQTGGAARNVAAWATFEANLNGVAVIAIRGAVSGSGATVTPGAISVVASTPQASAGQSITVSPAALAAAASLPAAATSTGAMASPAALAAVATLPQASPSAGSAVQPVALAAAASVPQAGVSVAAGPSALLASAALPQPTAGASTVAQPDPVAVAATLPAAATSAGSTVTPAALPLAVSVPQASPAVEGGVTATPSSLAATVSFPLPVVAAQTVVAPDAIPVLVTAPAPSVSAAAAVTPLAVAATMAFPQAAASGGGQSTDPVAATFLERVGAVFAESSPSTFREST